WMYKQILPARKQRRCTSFFSTGGGGGVDFASISKSPARAEKDPTSANIKSNAHILAMLSQIFGAISIIRNWQYNNRQILCKLFLAFFSSLNWACFQVLDDYFL